MNGVSAVAGYPICGFTVSTNDPKQQDSDFFAIGVVGVGDLSRYYLRGSLAGENLINGRSSCSFALSVHGGAGTVPFSIVPGNEVHISSRQGPIFSGSIDSVARTVPGSSDELQYQVNCVDFVELADRRLVIGAFEGSTQTLKDLVTTIHSTYLASEGISLGTVDTGPFITKVLFSYQRVSRALDSLSKITGSTYVWNIDSAKRLHFFERDTFDAPFDLTDTSGKVVQLVEGKSRSLYRNTQYIVGGRDVSDTRAEGFLGDGENRVFTLSLDVAEKPSISVNTVPVSASNIGIRDVDDVDWLYQIGDPKISKTTDSDLDDTPPAVGDVIDVTYKGFVPITVVLDRQGEVLNRQVIEEKTSGVYENVEQDDAIFEQNTARQKAEAVLDQFATIPSRIEYTTQEFGLEPGQLQNVQLTELGINGNYLIESVDFQDRGDYRCVLNIRATDGADVLEDVEFFKKLVEQGRTFVFNENQKLLQPEGTVETINVGSSLVVTQQDDTIDFDDDDYSIWLIGTGTLGHLVTKDGVPTITGPTVGAPEKYP